MKHGANMSVGLKLVLYSNCMKEELREDIFGLSSLELSLNPSAGTRIRVGFRGPQHVILGSTGLMQHEAGEIASVPCLD
jgi:hypothetical protein